MIEVYTPWDYCVAPAAAWSRTCLCVSACSVCIWPLPSSSPCSSSPARTGETAAQRNPNPLALDVKTGTSPRTWAWTLSARPSCASAVSQVTAPHAPSRSPYHSAPCLECLGPISRWPEACGFQPGSRGQLWGHHILRCAHEEKSSKGGMEIVHAVRERKNTFAHINTNILNAYRSKHKLTHIIHNLPLSRTSITGWERFCCENQIHKHKGFPLAMAMSAIENRRLMNIH